MLSRTVTVGILLGALLAAGLIFSSPSHAAVQIPMTAVDIWDIEGNYMRIVPTCEILIHGSEHDTFPNILREQSATPEFLETCFQESERIAVRVAWHENNTDPTLTLPDTY